MSETATLPTVQIGLSCRYKVFSPSKARKRPLETGYAERVEGEPFYRLYVTEPKKREFFIMPGQGGMHSAFNVFVEIRNAQGKFLSWAPVGCGDWSYDRKGVYVSTRYPEGSYIIVLEPSNFPFWKVDAR